jgi:hypothetical protein
MTNKKKTGTILTLTSRDQFNRYAEKVIAALNGKSKTVQVNFSKALDKLDALKFMLEVYDRQTRIMSCFSETNEGGHTALRFWLP